MYATSKERMDPERYVGVRLKRPAPPPSAAVFQGDHLQLASNQAVQKILQKQGEQSVLFADVIAKVNRSNRMVKRVLIITEKALYFLEAETFRLKKRVPLVIVESLSLSEYNDFFFAVNVPEDFDHLLISTRKTEIVTALNMAVQRSLGRELNVKFSNKFDYNIDSGTTREVEFTEVPEGISTRITSW